MKIDELQSFIDENIPLAEKAGLSLETVNSDLVVVSGRFENNKNHHGSVFGGSISMFQVLAGWILVQEIMKPICPDCSIVICRQEVEYLKPVCSDFLAEARLENKEYLDSFLSLYEQKGKGRLEVKVGLKEQGRDDVCAVFTGHFHISRKG